jgi:hypothetical protein
VQSEKQKISLAGYIDTQKQLLEVVEILTFEGKK